MNTFANSLKAEIARVARKELKAELDALRKTNASQRSDIAALKRDVRALQSRLLMAERVAGLLPVPLTPT
jgi:hypothetical protein